MAHGVSNFAPRWSLHAPWGRRRRSARLRGRAAVAPPGPVGAPPSLRSALWTRRRRSAPPHGRAAVAPPRPVDGPPSLRPAPWTRRRRSVPPCGHAALRRAGANMALCHGNGCLVTIGLLVGLVLYGGEDRCLSTAVFAHWLDWIVWVVGNGCLVTLVCRLDWF